MSYVVTFVETPLFKRLAAGYLSDEAYGELQGHLAAPPTRWSSDSRLRRGQKAQVGTTWAREAGWNSRDLLSAAGAGSSDLDVDPVSEERGRRHFASGARSEADPRGNRRCLRMSHRSIGVEILEGIRQLKRGRTGPCSSLPFGDGGPRTGRSVAVGVRAFAWRVGSNTPGVGTRPSHSIRPG